MLIAGGGTGGHLFPGIALAEEFLSRDPGHSVLFVGTSYGIEARAVPKAGFDLELIKVGGLKGKGLWGWLKGIFKLPRAIWQSRRILKKYRPDVVVGVGGYASGPVLLAAWLMRLPTAVLEQNALPGMTNRVLGRLVRRVFTAFPQAERFFKKKKVHMLGNPVRRAMAESLQQTREAGAKKSLLVFGGSQGARILNQVVPDAVKILCERLPELEVVHQTGERECEEVKQRYQKRGVDAEVLPFIHDMAAAYRKADLVVSRAGATTVAELSLCRKPAVLIPFPYAADNHQVINAQALVESGAAVMILQSDLDAQGLAGEAGAILADGKRRAEMEEAAALVARPDSARDICDSCLDLAEKSRWRKKEVANAS